jgi:hypothetical protein
MRYQAYDFGSKGSNSCDRAVASEANRHFCRTSWSGNSGRRRVDFALFPAKMRKIAAIAAADSKMTHYRISATLTLTKYEP